jgi:hypothetical protein
MEGVSPLWIYVGPVRLRISRSRFYIHLSPRVVDALGARRVIVRVFIEHVGGCTSVRLLQSDIDKNQRYIQGDNTKEDREGFGRAGRLRHPPRRHRPGVSLKPWEVEDYV